MFIFRVKFDFDRGLRETSRPIIDVMFWGRLPVVAYESVSLSLLRASEGVPSMSSAFSSPRWTGYISSSSVPDCDNLSAQEGGWALTDVLCSLVGSPPAEGGLLNAP